MLLVRLLRTCLVCLTIGLAGLSQPVRADPVDLSLDEARALARQALQTGAFQAAREIAAALLQIDPADRAALIVLAAAEPPLGRPAQGRMAGMRAWRLSTTSLQKFEAARLTALAAAEESRFTLSQFWLRRAAAHAPDAALLAQTGRDYQLVRAQNPVAIAVQLSFSPSTNINGGAESRFNIIEGLPFVGLLSGDAQALSGVVAIADLRLRYRLHQSAESLTEVGGQLIHRAVWMSSEARAIAPTSSNADFAASQSEISLSHWRKVGQAGLGATLSYGAKWSGELRDFTYVRPVLEATIPLNDALRLNLSGFVEQRDNVVPGRAANQIRGVSVGSTWTRDGGALLGGQLSWLTSDSVTPNLRSDAMTAQMFYVPARRLGPATLQFSLGASLADYAEYAVIFPVPGGRQDRSVFGSVDIALPDYSYAGFAPVVTLGARRVDSNVGRFDSSEVSMRIGFRSTF